MGAAGSDDLDTLPRAHARRLRDIYRSAGWPACDAIEIDLLAAGLLQRVGSVAGAAETLRLTDAGIALLARSLQRNRAAFDAHEALVERVVREMQRAGRVAWRGLGLRAKVETGWVIARPDVYSLRHTTVEAFLAPLVHEVKVRRADLLADLRLPYKRAAYLQAAGACSYVLAEGIAEADEIPLECGVIVARRRPEGWAALECLRPAPLRPRAMPFGVWMALARATPATALIDDEQALLGDPAGPDGMARASDSGGTVAGCLGPEAAGSGSNDSQPGVEPGSLPGEEPRADMFPPL